MSPEWGLFVDESGAFEKPDRSVVSAGILFRLDVPRVRASLIEQALSKLSHIAASGWARGHIEASRRGQRVPPAPPRVKRWARNQAMAWADDLRSRS